MGIGTVKKAFYIYCIRFFVSSFFVIFFAGKYNLLYSQWIVEKIVDNNESKGNYDISGSRFVWESYDGNDWEIFYSRDNDVICGRRYNLIMHCGNGNQHKLGGITKVGGKKRINGVKYDYEGLIHFDLRAFYGRIRKAQMKIFFEPYSSSKYSCKYKTGCQSCTKCKPKKQCGVFCKCNSGSHDYFGRYYYNRSVNIYKYYLTSGSRYRSPYRFKYMCGDFEKIRSNLYSKSYKKKHSYLDLGACFNPSSFYRSILCKKSKPYCNPNPGCNHKCGYKPPNIVIYSQNRGPRDMKTVNYNTFEHCPWDDKIGEISVS
ncbi:MAG: hypothetical protein PVI26_02320, partial [Chitinispirillia bacterium]